MGHRALGRRPVTCRDICYSRLSPIGFIAMMRSCLVADRIVIFEDEGANRARVLDLLVDRDVERTAALGFDLGLLMESSEVRATPSAAPPQPRRANHPAGRDPMGRLGHTPAGTATLRSRT